MTESPVKIAQSESELFRILRLRYEVYVERQGKALPGIDHQLRTVRDELDLVATHFYVHDESGEIVACGRSTVGAWPTWCDRSFLIPAFAEFRREQFCYISKVMLNPHLSSRSALASIFIAMYRDGRVRNAPFGIANCNPKLSSLYARFGWRQFGPDFCDPYVGMQAPIMIVAHDTEYLRRRGSILLDTAEQFANDPTYARWFEKQFPEYADAGS